MRHRQTNQCLMPTKFFRPNNTYFPKIKSKYARSRIPLNQQWNRQTNQCLKLVQVVWEEAVLLLTNFTGVITNDNVVRTKQASYKPSNAHKASKLYRPNMSKWSTLHPALKLFHINLSMYLYEMIHAGQQIHKSYVTFNLGLIFLWKLTTCVN